MTQPDDGDVAPASRRRTIEGGETRLIVLLGAVTAFAPFAIDMYLASLGDVARSLAVDLGEVQFTLSIYFIGMAVGQFFYGPAIDRWGRKGPLMVGIALFAVTSFGLVIAPDLRSFVVLRFLQAMGGCGGMIVARAIIRDVYDLRGASAMLSQMMLVQGLGPVLAPIIGAQLVALSSWHLIFVVLAASGVFWFGAVWWGLPETLPKADRTVVGPGRIVAVFGALACRLDFVLPALIAASAAGSIFAFIGGSSFVFMELHGLSRQAYALIFGANALALIAAAQINRLLVRSFRPRHIVIGAALFASLSALALVLVAGIGSWPLLLPPLFLTSATVPIIAANAQAIAMANSGAHTGSASSLVGILQYSIAGAIVSSVGMLHDGTALPMTGAIAGCVFVATALALVATRLSAR